MRKLRVIVLEDYVEAVLRSLGETDLAHFIDMREKTESWKEILTPNVVSPETLKKCSDILAKIDALFGNLASVARGREKGAASKTVPVTRESIEEVLARVERKLAEMPGAKIEVLVKCSKLVSAIDQLIETLGVKLESIKPEEVAPLQQPAEKVIADVELELSEILTTADILGLTDRHAFDFGLESSPSIERIRPLAEKKGTDFGKEAAEQRKHYIESEKVFGKRLQRLKKLASIAREAIQAEIKPEELREDLAILRMTIDRESQIAKTEEQFVRSAKTVFFEAWVSKEHVKEAVERIDKASDGNCIVTDEAPAHEDKVPIILKPFPGYLAAFEKLVYAFGYPSSEDINPVRVFAVTFPILFGIMFADVGQGAIFVILGLLLTLLKRRIKLEKVGDIMRYLFISSEMFILLGTCAIFFGFIFGDFFGPSGVIHPISLGKIGPFYIGGFEPKDEPMKMLKFAILVGAIHLSLGLILKFVNEVKHKHLKLAPVPICWMWLLVGGLFMWAYWGGISNISRWFSEGLLMTGGLIALPLVFILAFTGLAKGFMEGIGFSVEVFAETLSHAMSYSRLMALGLIHSAMNYLFLVLGGVEHGHFPLGSIPLIAIGTILVMIIEGLVVFVHTLRLHWVEWFSKFHTGEGIAFKPFRFTKS